MSNKRLISTVLTSLLGLFLAYTSYFYFPAYQSKPSVIKISTQDGSIPSAAKNETNVLGPYLDHLLMNRGYMKAGQTVSTTYTLSAGTQLKLIISRCAGPIIIEVYSCNGSIIEVVEIGSHLEGKVDLTVESNGFYQFTERVIELPADNFKYQVVWKRL